MTNEPTSVFDQMSEEDIVAAMKRLHDYEDLTSSNSGPDQLLAQVNDIRTSVLFLTEAVGAVYGISL